MKKTMNCFRQLRAERSPIVMVTGYDYPTAVLEQEAGVDVILVGDSLGTNILGYASEREVTLADILHHLRAVRRGAPTTYLLADLPYQTYQTPVQAVESARQLLDAGADGVKLEGALPEIVRALVQDGVEVCGHLGYTPQTAGKPGYRAKSATAALEMLADAKALAEAGAAWIVLETIPEEVAQFVTERLEVPTIGIGAGRYCSGQVLLVVDLLGVTPMDFIHNKKFQELRGLMLKGLTDYSSEVRAGLFPGESNVRHLSATEFEQLQNSNLE